MSFFEAVTITLRLRPPTPEAHSIHSSPKQNAEPKHTNTHPPRPCHPTLLPLEALTPRLHRLTHPEAKTVVLRPRAASGRVPFPPSSCCCSNRWRKSTCRTSSRGNRTVVHSWCAIRKSFNDRYSHGTFPPFTRVTVCPSHSSSDRFCFDSRSYFRQTKYSSFQRQLNIYEFQRISTGPDKNAYYHLSFQRGKNDLLPLIKRVTVKGTGIRKAPAPEDEPNFYEMAPIAAADPPVSTTVTLEAPSRSLPSLPITGLGLGAHPFTSPTTNLTSLDLLSQLSQIRGLSSQTLPSTTSLYTPLTSLDLGLTLRRAQQMLEEGQLRDAWTRLSALEQLRNQNSSSLLLGGGVPMRSAAELPSLLPPTSNSLLQQFLLKNGTRNFS